MSATLLTLAALAVATAMGAALTYYRLAPVRPAVPRDEPVLAGPVFLFGGDDLIDTTADAQQMIAPYAHMSDRDAVLHVLAPHFPALADYVISPVQRRCRIAHCRDDDLWLDIDWPAGQLRVAVMGTSHARSLGAQFIDRVHHDELALLQDIARYTPQLIWRTDKDGAITWANQAYLDLWDQHNPDSALPLAQRILFAGPCGKTTDRSPSLRRIAVQGAQHQAELWFDVTSLRQDSGTLHFASDANAAVRADQERRNFVQTLGKTFAELSIGLAIFDKHRRLATFNPALLDMTRLGFDFLSARPSIDTVLDRLRETRFLPEPKDYASWRDQFTAVETAAKNGTYSEVWNLHDGQAFRVTGRPHPDGAFAFLFEDITADLSLTRRFRSDLETSQAVLDALPDAVAVFSMAGTLVMFNRAYRLLWGMQADTGLEHRGLEAELNVWQSRSIDTGTWAELVQFIHQQGPRQPWTDEALLADGRRLRCHIGPIAGGMTMVRFVPDPAGLPALRKLTQIDPAIRVAKR
ncbi:MULTISPECIES: PAS-domain containing protein [unclassified Yoonia]|uniref:PAS-domain containing protein n=1 Tax=unclassified Yoonia TaxID=2629118 RepID=UPI002AFDD5FF|nr:MULTISPECIES: PAS-domain containing protein [unclassified Yoonia]